MCSHLQESIGFDHFNSRYFILSYFYTLPRIITINIYCMHACRTSKFI
jgi:hypothetical protein